MAPIDLLQKVQIGSWYLLKERRMNTLLFEYCMLTLHLAFAYLSDCELHNLQERIYICVYILKTKFNHLLVDSISPTRDNV